MSSNGAFLLAIEKMTALFEALNSSPLRHRTGLGKVPHRGVYVFYENDLPVYVGRSNDVRQRVLQHGRPSSTHNSATFAFLLALDEAQRRGFAIKGMQRKALQEHPEFRELFRQAKQQVSRMAVRIVEVSDPIEQTLFEVYVHMALGTAYNSFENH